MSLDEVFRKFYPIYIHSLQKILMNFGQNIDKKKAFFIGFLASKCEKSPDELVDIYDFLNTRDELSNKNLLMKIQNEENKQFFSEKKQKEKENEENSMFFRIKRLLPFSSDRKKRNNILVKHSSEKEINEEKNQDLIKAPENNNLDKLEENKNDNAIQKEETCKICMSSLFESPIHLLENCPHIFHSFCIREYLINEIDAKNKIPIKCPEENCQNFFSQREISDLLPLEKKEEYLNISLKTYIDYEGKDVSWCPSPDCAFAFINPPNLQTHFTCPLCSKQYCLHCRVEYHFGKTCEEFCLLRPKTKEDQAFETFVNGLKFKQCKQCKFWVEKTQGCDHMRCRCGNEFCYKCGGPYQKCGCKPEDFCAIF